MEREILNFDWRQKMRFFNVLEILLVQAEMGVFTGEIATTLKMSENYSDVRKPVMNWLFCHARGCFLLKFRLNRNFQEIHPKIQKN